MNPSKVTVDLGVPTPYAESRSKMHRLKRRMTYRDILKHVSVKLCRFPQASVLEVGTGSGFLLQILEDKYPEATIHGLEYDPRLVEITRSKLKRAQIVEGNAESFEIKTKFDVIVSSQVIEHLFHPESMLDCVHRHLKPGGIFVMTTPNLGCLSARVMGKKWHGYRSDHVALKTFQQWVEFVESHGFTTRFAGSTFFSGIPILNRFPLGLFNWALLLVFGSMRWSHGESFFGVFERK